MPAARAYSFIRTSVCDPTAAYFNDTEVIGGGRGGGVFICLYDMLNMYKEICIVYYYCAIFYSQKVVLVGSNNISMDICKKEYFLISFATVLTCRNDKSAACLSCPTVTVTCSHL